MENFQIFPTNEKALCSWRKKEQLSFGIVDFKTAKCNKLKFIADKDGECKVSVGVDGFVVAQGRKLFCFNNKGDKWR